MNTVTLTAPTLPDPTSTMQSMVNAFTQGGSYALSIIGAAVGLGIIVILAVYAWGLLKKWLHKAK